jgi:hypothetical protein
MLNGLSKFEGTLLVNGKVSESICPRSRRINVNKIKVFEFFYYLFYFYFYYVILLITIWLKLLIYN